MQFNKKTDQITIRDPFIVPFEDKYYMYGSSCELNAAKYSCYVGEDLENWAGPFDVFVPQEGYDGIKDFWAPECHYYKGNFYLLATYFSKTTNHRGVSIFKSKEPLGPFKEITDGYATPDAWDCIDGTLFIDENEQPWMVFVHEWTSMPDKIGDMSAAKLSEDFTHFISEPIRLFKADEVDWAAVGVTDGPFLYRSKSDALLMLWSNFNKDGYCVAIAKSDNGLITGNWQQQEILYCKNLISDYDGGHGMLFKDKDGKLMISMHSPNAPTKEKETNALFLEVIDRGDMLTLK